MPDVEAGKKYSSLPQFQFTLDMDKVLLYDLVFLESERSGAGALAGHQGCDWSQWLKVGEEVVEFIR